jgi:hypothetical protein
MKYVLKTHRSQAPKERAGTKVNHLATQIRQPHINSVFLGSCLQFKEGRKLPFLKDEDHISGLCASLETSFY